MLDSNVLCPVSAVTSNKQLSSFLQAQPPNLAPHMVRICEAAATPLMGGVRVTRSLQENAAITLGRAAWACPAQVAPLLPHFLGPWCNALRNVKDDLEKEDAFRGLVAVVRENPRASLSSFAAVAGGQLAGDSAEQSAETGGL